MFPDSINAGPARPATAPLPMPSRFYAIFSLSIQFYDELHGIYSGNVATGAKSLGPAALLAQIRHENTSSEDDEDSRRFKNRIRQTKIGHH
jgi:hypothetical protein